jgi:hypothetical protein
MNDEELLKKYPALKQELLKNFEEDDSEHQEVVANMTKQGLLPKGITAKAEAILYGGEGQPTLTGTHQEIVDSVFESHSYGGESKFKHKALDHHLILMQVGPHSDSPWVVVNQSFDLEEMEEAVHTLDEEIDGYFDLRLVTVTTQVLEEVPVDEGQ